MNPNTTKGVVALKEPFQIGGTIRVAGPSFKEMAGRGEQVTVEEDHVEFYVQIENASQEKVLELNPWVSMAEADVEIAVEYPEDCDPADDLLAVSFKGAMGRTLELNINSAQARALQEILTNFVRACDSWDALKKVYPVSATA